MFEMMVRVYHAWRDSWVYYYLMRTVVLFVYVRMELDFLVVYTTGILSTVLYIPISPPIIINDAFGKIYVFILLNMVGYVVTLNLSRWGKDLLLLVKAIVKRIKK